MKPWDCMIYGDRVNATDQSFFLVEFHEIELVTRPFTRDGFAAADGHNALCNDFDSFKDKPFQCMDLRGHHTWINAPFRELTWIAEHYLRAKYRAP